MYQGFPARSPPKGCLYLQATQEKVAAVLQVANLKEQLRALGEKPASSPTVPPAQQKGYSWRVICSALKLEVTCQIEMAIATCMEGQQNLLSL